MKKETWLDNLVEFYDFIWEEGINACASCINKELLQDFQSGGDKFEMMKMAIIKKFPTKAEAEKAFKNNQPNPLRD